MRAGCRWDWFSGEDQAQIASTDDGEKPTVIGQRETGGPMNRAINSFHTRKNLTRFFRDLPQLWRLLAEKSKLF